MGLFAWLRGRGQPSTVSPEEVGEWLFRAHMDFFLKHRFTRVVINMSTINECREDERREAPIAFATACCAYELALVFHYIYGDLDHSDMYLDADPSTLPKVLDVLGRMRAHIKPIAAQTLVLAPDTASQHAQREQFDVMMAAAPFSVLDIDVLSHFMIYLSVMRGGLDALMDQRTGKPYPRWEAAGRYATGVVDSTWELRTQGEAAMVALYAAVEGALHPQVRAGVMHLWDPKGGLTAVMSTVNLHWIEHTFNLNLGLMSFVRGKRMVF